MSLEDFRSGAHLEQHGWNGVVAQCSAGEDGSAAQKGGLRYWNHQTDQYTGTRSDCDVPSDPHTVQDPVFNAGLHLLILESSGTELNAYRRIGSLHRVLGETLPCGTT